VRSRGAVASAAHDFDNVAAPRRAVEDSRWGYARAPRPRQCLTGSEFNSSLITADYSTGISPKQAPSWPDAAHVSVTGDLPL
jgi:hypothetical protein